MASCVFYRWEFEKRGESFALDVPGPLILDESDQMLQAAAWKAVLEDWLPVYPGLCLYYPGRRNVPAKLPTFIELVREQSK